MVPTIENVVDAIAALQEINDHLNSGAPYTEHIRCLMLGLFQWMWQQASAPGVV